MPTRRVHSHRTLKNEKKVSPLKTLTICKLALMAGMAILAGCSAEQKAVAAAQHKAEIEAAVSAYDNQLVQPGEPYAVLSAQPRPIDDVAVFSPYRLLTINGKKLEGTPYSFTRARPLPRDLAFSELKVPAGTHDLTINGGAVRAYFTKFSNVKFEVGKRYAIVEELAPDETITVHISEYRQDKRFAPSDKEYYVIGKRISDAVERGSATVMNLQGPKP
jgi:hypothetical protein